MAKILIVIGAACIAAGLLWMALDYIGISRFIGHLAGVINVSGRIGSFHFSIVTCLIISVVLTIIVNVFFRR